MAKRTHKRGSMGDVAAVVAASENLADAARRLGVNRSTVLRWVAKGHAPQPGSARPAIGTERALSDPQGWAATVRETFADDPTQLELLTLAEQALKMAKDVTAAPATQLQAMGRFQALVKQLYSAGDAAQTPTVPARAAGVQRPVADPRSILMAVK